MGFPKMYTLPELYALDDKQLISERNEYLRSLHYRCTWKTRGWKTETSECIASSLVSGDLSGTCYLVAESCLLPKVAEVYFDPYGRPRVVAVYESYEE